MRKLACILFGLTYFGSTLLFLASILGWFGLNDGSAAKMILFLLGLPWNWMADQFSGAHNAILIASPLINLAILLVLSKR